MPADHLTPRTGGMDTKAPHASRPLPAPPDGSPEAPKQRSLSLLKRILILGAAPVLGLAVVGGFFVARVVAEYRQTASDNRVMAAYQVQLRELADLHTTAKKEREAALLFAASGSPRWRDAFTRAVVDTDRAATVFRASAVRLREGPDAAVFKASADTAIQALDETLPAIRTVVAAGKATPADVMKSYSPVAFRTSRVIESVRFLLRNPTTINFCDGLQIVVNMREAEGMVLSLLQLSAADYVYPGADMALIR